MERISISLYDHWLSHQEIYNEKMPKLESFADFHEKSDNVDDKLKYLLAALQVLDPSERVTPLILEHTLGSEEDSDFENKLNEFLPKNRLSGPQASLYRIITICTLALGKAFTEAGNSKLGLHMVTLAATFQERVIRTAPRAQSDENVTRLLYSTITHFGLKLNDYEQSIEAGTKLISRWDVILADILDGQKVVEEFDVAEYYSTLMLLANAGEKCGNYQCSVYACSKALELFSNQRKVLKDGGNLLDFISFDEKLKACPSAAEIIQQNLCLRLIKANEAGNGDAFISLDASRSALEHFDLVHGSSKDFNPVTETLLQFLLGRMIYKSSLSLAGGLEHASSPPIAMLSPGVNTPTIKGLLEESIDVLEEVLRNAKEGRNDADCKEAIFLQIAIVAMELRQEEKAQDILEKGSVYNSTLLRWDACRRDGTEQSTFGYWANVTYSREVFKRLVAAAPNPSLRQTGSKLTLSRKRTTILNLPLKVLCSFCSMQCINSDLKCEPCAEAKIYIWYCSEECLNDHKIQHKPQCAINGGSIDSPSIPPSVLDFSSFLPFVRDRLI